MPSSRPDAFVESRKAAVHIFVLLLVLWVVQIGTSGSPAVVNGVVKLVRILGGEWFAGDFFDDLLELEGANEYM